MKTLFFVISASLFLASCSSNSESSLEAEQKAVIARNISELNEAKPPVPIINQQLDSAFALMVDSAKKHYTDEDGTVFCKWKESSQYRRDSAGNRLIHVYFHNEGEMRGEEGNSDIIIAQAQTDTVIKQKLPYSDGTYKKDVEKIKKGDIIVCMDGYVLAHAKPYGKIKHMLVDVLDTYLFDKDWWSMKTTVD